MNQNAYSIKFTKKAPTRYSFQYIIYTPGSTPDICCGNPYFILLALLNISRNTGVDFQYSNYLFSAS